MRRSSTIVSIVVHAVVVAAACITQLLAVGPLPPVPHDPLSFVGVIPIRIVDIPLPPPQRVSRGPDVAPAAVGMAPIEAPSTLSDERPSACADCAAAADAVGVERGIPSSVVFGSAQPPPPPPPPPPPQTQTPIRLRGGMQAPRKVTHVDPGYPRVAQAAHVEGTVILEAIIDASGAVTSVRVLRSIPLLDQAAVDAVRGWKFTPTLLNGVPVPIALTVTVRFTLTDR